MFLFRHCFPIGVLLTFWNYKNFELTVITTLYQHAIECFIAERFIISCEKSELGCPGVFQLMERLSSNQKQRNNSIEPNCFIIKQYSTSASGVGKGYSHGWCSFP